MNYAEIKKILLDATGADTTLKEKWGNRADEIDKTRIPRS